jgi:hypothetical protein
VITLTREQVIEITTAVMKSVTSQIDIPRDRFDHVIDVVSQTVVKALLDSGARLDWIKNVRSN